MIKKLLISLLLLITLSSCSKQEKYEAQVFDTFDTIITFTSYQNSKKDFEKYKDILEKEFKRYNDLYDNYNAYKGINNIFMININAGKKELEVDKDIIDLLEFSKDYYNKTNHSVNIAMGSVLSEWHDFREEGIKHPKKAKLPEMKVLKEKNKYTDINDIEVNKEKSTVYINNPNTKIDVGAVAKGFAVEKIKQKLIKEGLDNGIISAGGNVVTIGDNPKSEDGYWKIAVQNPDFSSKEYANVLKVKDCAIVTSGDYQRYYEVDGKRYNHIINPKTLMPATDFTSVTVITDDSAKADAFSTALFVNNLEDGKEMIKNKNIEVLWIDKDYKQTKTKNLDAQK
ncbi:MAG: FAD:protein FMN transferase [Tissierellia bacterium]|nr:FAD:protein FMN transferase [Tissierellia bacterium]